MVRFTHGGATGDIIFSLPTIKAMGGGELYITKYDEQRANSIAELIRLQPYITSVEVVATPPEDCINLNKFRDHAGHHHNLVEAHFKGQGIPVERWQDGWLKSMPAPAYFQIANYCVINRTTNYADPNFNWAKEVDYLFTLAPDVIFIGYESEYNIFQELFNRPMVRFIPCSFLEAAYLIHNAKMFTGCYSAMSTIAMGLGINYRLEQAPGHTCSSLNEPRETIINV
jgi:hypothetical protein